MEAIGEQISSALEFPIDFEGQKKAHHYVTLFLYVSVIASVLTGFFTQNIIISLYTFAASIVTIAIVVLPPWSVYNKNPVEWLQVKYEL